MCAGGRICDSCRFFSDVVDTGLSGHRQRPWKDRFWSRTLVFSSGSGYDRFSYRLVTEVFGKKSATDCEIVASVRDGDHRAEGLLVQRYYGRVLARVRAKVGDRQASADITQDVILGVLSALREGRLRCPDRLAQYVSGTTSNIVRRHLNRRAPVPEFDLDSIACGAPPLDELVSRRQQLDAVARAFDRLTRRDREILAMTLSDGLTSREVARLTGMSPALVRQRKARALRKLRTEASYDLIEKFRAGS